MKREDVISRCQEAGLTLKSEERLKNDTGWQFRFESGEIVNVFDNGTVSCQGKNTSRTRQLLGGEPSPSGVSPAPHGSRRVFIVYGHDENARTQLEAMLRRWQLEPLILDQLPSEGQTIIEKLEKYTQQDVRFGVVLATPDDEGHRRGKPDEKKHRAAKTLYWSLAFSSQSSAARG